MPAPERRRGLHRLRGLRVVADPASLDAAHWQGDNGAERDEILVLRFAPDDAFAIGASAVQVDDEHAIIESETGFVGAWLPVDDVRPHLEWSLPSERPALAQGSIANVPARLWLPDEGDALLVTAAAYADELAGRMR